MIKYIDDLYLTEYTSKNLSKIKLKLRLGAGMIGLYVIMMSDSEYDVFDIVPSQMFKVRKYRHMDHTVIGLAESRRKACRIVEQLISEHFERTGQYTDLKADYLTYFGLTGKAEVASDTEDKTEC